MPEHVWADPAPMTGTDPQVHSPVLTPMSSYHPPSQYSPTSPAKSGRHSHEEPDAEMGGDGSTGNDTARATEGMDEHMRRSMGEPLSSDQQTKNRRHTGRTLFIAGTAPSVGQPFQR